MDVAYTTEYPGTYDWNIFDPDVITGDVPANIQTLLDQGSFLGAPKKGGRKSKRRIRRRRSKRNYRK